jgi:hypothetical protein
MFAGLLNRSRTFSLPLVRLARTSVTVRSNSNPAHRH